MTKVWCYKNTVYMFLWGLLQTWKRQRWGSLSQRCLELPVCRCLWLFMWQVTVPNYTPGRSCSKAGLCYPPAIQWINVNKTNCTIQDSDISSGWCIHLLHNPGQYIAVSPEFRDSTLIGCLTTNLVKRRPNMRYILDIGHIMFVTNDQLCEL